MQSSEYPPMMKSRQNPCLSQQVALSRHSLYCKGPAWIQIYYFSWAVSLNYSTIKPCIISELYSVSSPRELLIELNVDFRWSVTDCKEQSDIVVVMKRAFSQSCITIIRFFDCQEQLFQNVFSLCLQSIQADKDRTEANPVCLVLILKHSALSRVLYPQS